jgi:hypothetical protein
MSGLPKRVANLAATPIAPRHQHSYLTMAGQLQAILREFLDFLEINRPPLPCSTLPRPDATNLPKSGPFPEELP